MSHTALSFSVRPLLTALVVSLASPALAAVPDRAEPYTALAALEARVAAIGFRLATANAGWCPVLQPQLGLIWGDPRLYEPAQLPAARTAYGATDTDAPFIAAVAPGSPAALTGMAPGMAITTINGAALPDPLDDAPFARIATLETWLSSFPRDAPVTLGDGDKTLQLDPVPGCVSDFRVEARDAPAGAADGRLVLISAGLAHFASNDDELAATVAHEMAHNILRHRNRLDAAGVDRGLGKQFGRSARLFRQTEVEADRLSAWLLAGAGYDPAAATRFWTAFGERKGRSLFQAGTHPRWRARITSIEGEIAAIDAARAAGQPLHPPLIDAPPPLE